MLKKGDVGNNSTISQLINDEESATAKIKRLQAENDILQSKLTQKNKEPSSTGFMGEENSLLKAENAQ